MIVTLAQAREWCTAHINEEISYRVNIKIRQTCENPACAKAFVSFLYSCLIAPRFCSRECADAVYPPYVHVPRICTSGRRGSARRSKKHEPTPRDTASSSFAAASSRAPRPEGA